MVAVPEDVALNLFRLLTRSSVTLLKGKICSNFPDLIRLLKLMPEASSGVVLITKGFSFLRGGLIGS